jgi:hypothetical protein
MGFSESLSSDSTGSGEEEVYLAAFLELLRHLIGRIINI